MSSTTLSASPSSEGLRRLAAPILTIVAAVAGVVAGTRIGEPSGEVGLMAMVVLVGACALAAWAVSLPSGDALSGVGLDAFRAELDRARRHRRTFAMARLELAQPLEGPVGDSSSAGIDRATIGLVGASLRITDRAWLEDGDAIILLPESDRATAEAFAGRVRAAAPGRFTDRTGFAVFPDDGLTSGALLDALERGVQGDAQPAPLVRTTVEGATPVQPDDAASNQSGVG